MGVHMVRNRSKTRLIGIDDNFRYDAGVGFAAGILFIFLNMISSISIGIPAPIYPQSHALPDVAIALIASLAVTVFLAAIAEEIGWRGALFFLWQKLGVSAVPIVVVLVSIAFSLFHWKVYGIGMEAAFVGAFIFSVLACILVLITRSVVPSIVMHGMVNLYLFVTSYQLFTIGGV